MSKTESDSTKREQKKQAKWVVTIFCVTILVSATISFLSNEIMAASGMLVAVLILLAIVAIGIVFDIVGVAVTSADEKPFHSMASRRVPGAKEAIALLRNAGKVSSICNDVVGDICGVVSGAASASIAARVLAMGDFSLPQLVTLAMSALVAGLTVGGKAVGKTVAIRSCTDIVYLVEKFWQPSETVSSGCGKRKTEGRVDDTVGILQDIHCQEDLLRLTDPQRACLCREIREFLIDSVSKTGATHLSDGAVPLRYREKHNRGGLVSYNGTTIKLKKGHTYNVCVSGMVNAMTNDNSGKYSVRMTDGYDDNYCRYITLIEQEGRGSNSLCFNRIYDLTGAKNDVELKFSLEQGDYKTYLLSFSGSVTITALD